MKAQRHHEPRETKTHCSVCVSKEFLTMHDIPIIDGVSMHLLSAFFDRQLTIIILRNFQNVRDPKLNPRFGRSTLPYVSYVYTLLKKRDHILITVSYLSNNCDFDSRQKYFDKKSAFVICMYVKPTNSRMVSKNTSLNING